MTNQAIKIENINVSDWSEKRSWKRADNLCENLQKKINEKCPEGYKYKETISFEKNKDFNWIEAIVIYEQIPR